MMEDRADIRKLQKELEKECKESKMNKDLYETLLQEHENVRYQLAEARLYIDRLRIGIDSPFYVVKTVHEIELPCRAAPSRHEHETASSPSDGLRGSPVHVLWEHPGDRHTHKRQLLLEHWRRE